MFTLNVTPAAQRKRDERARHRKAGRVVVQYWVHPKDRAALDAFVAQLRDQEPAAAPQSPV